MGRDYINKIFCEDCLNTMKQMVEDNVKVDMILTSPPYNTVRDSEYYNNQNSLDKHMGRYDVYMESKTDEEYIDWTINLFNLFDKVLKPNSVIIYNLSYGSENTELMWRVIYNILERTDFTIADNIIWKKKSALPNAVSHNKLTRICEYVYVFCRNNEFDTFHCNKRLRSVNDKGQKYYEAIFNFIEAPNNDGANKLNKATFSTELVRRLLEIYSLADKNIIVYDPFMGTGTTANACKQYGVSYVGSEISENQVKYANERLNYKTLNDYF